MSKHVINHVKRRQTILKGKANSTYAVTDGTKLYQDTSSGADLDSGTGYDNAISFIIATRNIDRDGDVLDCDGGDWKAYSRNPVCFWGHQDIAIPIGTSRGPDGQLHVFPSKQLIRATCFFDVQDEDAMFICSKVKRGFLNAASIAFIPIDAECRDGGRGTECSGWHFLTWEATEWSIVGCPANAEAIRDSLDTEKSFISPRLQKALMPYAAKARNLYRGGVPVSLDTIAKKLDRMILKYATSVTKPTHSAQVLLNLHAHLKDADRYTQQELGVMDHPGVESDLGEGGPIQKAHAAYVKAISDSLSEHHDLEVSDDER